ncbi:hypothetical protein E3N88_32537 [Mikania micrantha]|uniref:Myosin motor domain-containing protein n=1 Tax=Mikania micrantha TaxID=192012 RepID=A0A5N6M991_9ASTR|nr:hypothetical protein E3N88_32537 [Mikania micrantha]
MSTSSNIIVGSQVWVEDNEISWIDGDVLEINGKEIKVKCSSGKEVVTTVSSVYPKDPEFPECGENDMTKLAYLHEPGVLQNLKSRFDMDEIYMVNEGISQSILVSGESGAGKTESTKNLMQYLAYMGGRIGDERSVEQKVLESNPVLEAFGNAKTVRNNNSSRFGKFVELQFNEQGSISGAAIRTYLLERSRVCQVSDPERSYHCFYMLCAAPPEVSEKYKLGDPRMFRYLNQSNCYQLTGVDESKEYLATKHAMGVVGISPDEQEAIFRVVAAIIHLGNVEFNRGSEPDSSQPKDDKSRFHLKTAAELFMCDETALQESFCQRVMVTRGESIKKSLDPNSAAISRDALAKIVYSRLFDWIVTRINNSIGQDAKSKFLIGVLDIYGFESFKTNSFEQFCINLTNEKLQQHFNQHVFKMEQEEYSKEEINWSYIEFVDNQDILDLIEKKPGGILALLDEACMFPRSTHATFAEKLYQTFKDHKRFSKPKLSNTDFTICHYAGDVTYQSDYFLDKNKDYVVAEHQALMNASKCFFVSSLFPPSSQDSSKASKFISIGSQFKQQLQALLETLSHTEPHYVRCVKPNNLLKPAIFENPNILQQLRCGGVMEAIRISCAGFPTRKPFHEFVDRFKILSPNVMKLRYDEVEASKILLEKAKLEGYQIGKTKVFLRAGQMAEIDARRSEVLGRSAIKIQSKFRAYSTCNKFILLRSSAILMQTICRGEMARLCYEHQRRERACLRIQKNIRTHHERTRYRFMSSSVIFIQNGMRGMAARNAYNDRRQTKAAISIQSRCRQYLARHHYLKTRNVAIYAQSVLRKDLAHIELKRIKKVASDTNALHDAKSKLEKQVKELSMQLQQEQHIRADMEETKNKENAKLQSAIDEMEVQFQETKELLEAAKREIEQVRAADNEKIETLATDNEKLKDVVNSLKMETNEIQQKYEETSKLSEDRLKEAMDAEAKIIELKIDMQRFLQEKIADMEAEDQLLRQKVILKQPTVIQNHYLDEHQSGSPSKKFDSNLTQSTIGRERELVDTVMKSATQDLGFSQGKPIATYVIYKSLLHCKAFEHDVTTIFDRIIQMMGSAIEESEDIKHMAYWLSVTSTLFFLIQKTLSPSPPKPQQPTSLFGRMTQGFRSTSIISIVCHVDVKYPALLFKKQLAAYVEKLYGFIRNNLKKDFSQILSSCIQVRYVTKSSIVILMRILTCMLIILTISAIIFQVPLVVIQKIIFQLFSFTDVQLFNSLLLHKECCTFANGKYLKEGLSKLETWCSKATTEYAGLSSDELKHVRQAVGFLVIQQKSKISYDDFTTKLCPVLSIQQLYRLCTLYSTDNDETHSVAQDVISKLKVLMSEDFNDPDSDSYLLDDTSSMAFPVDEIAKSINEKDFSNMKPTSELLEKPEFQFLLEFRQLFKNTWNGMYQMDRFLMQKGWLVKIISPIEQEV